MLVFKTQRLLNSEALPAHLNNAPPPFKSRFKIYLILIFQFARAEGTAKTHLRCLLKIKVGLIGRVSDPC